MNALSKLHKQKEKVKKAVAKKAPPKMPCFICKKELFSTKESLGKHLRAVHPNVADDFIFAQYQTSGRVGFFCGFCKKLTNNPGFGGCSDCTSADKMVLMAFSKLAELLDNFETSLETIANYVQGSSGIDVEEENQGEEETEDGATEDDSAEEEDGDDEAEEDDATVIEEVPDAEA